MTGTAENQLDDFIVGTLAGTTVLGAYNIAWRLVQAYTVVVQTAISRGILPTFARLKEDPERRRDGLELLVRTQSYLIVPLYIVVAFAAEPIVLVTFGNQWLDAVPVLRAFAVAGILFPLVNTVRQYHYSLGRPNIVTKVNVVILGSMSLFLPPLVLQWGGFGAAIGLVLVESIALGAFLWSVQSDVAFSVRRTLVPAALSGGVTVMPLVALKHALSIRTLLQMSVWDLPPFILEFSELVLIAATVFLLFYLTLYVLDGDRFTDDIRTLFDAISSE